VFEEVEERYHRGASGYDTYDGREAFYYLGRYSFVVGQHDSAMVFFKRCENLSRRVDKDGPSGFRSMANLHMGMIYDMRGRRQEALQQYRIVLAMDEYEQSHRDARAYLKKPYGK
jgi:tetratricopeptide (TPR) repeat protein